jgi:hypothetical protein
MNCIPALAWAGQLRLSALTGETQWREKALRAVETFTSGQTPAIAEPYRLTSLAGALLVGEGSAAADAKVGAGETKAYYLNRPVVNGADDRGGAMALLAAIEMANLRNTG